MIRLADHAEHKVPFAYCLHPVCEVTDKFGAVGIEDLSAKTVAVFRQNEQLFRILFTHEGYFVEVLTRVPVEGGTHAKISDL